MGLFSTPYSSVLEAWQFRISALLAERQGFRGAEFVDVRGYSQLLDSSHLRERDKLLLRAIWNGILLGQAKKEEVPCRFCCGKDGDAPCSR